MKFRILGLIACGVLGTVASEARAGFVTNGGFETPVASGTFQTFNAPSTAITGWTVIAGTQDASGSVDLLTNAFANAHSGNQSVDLDGTNGPNSAGGVAQTLTGLTIGTSYLLDFFYANNPNATGTAGALVTIGGLSVNIFHSGSTATAMNYTEGLYSFVATAASMNLSFQSTDPGAALNGIVLDDVSVNVPEPASCAMLGLGIVGVGAYARARRRTA